MVSGIIFHCIYGIGASEQETVDASLVSVVATIGRTYCAYSL